MYNREPPDGQVLITCEESIDEYRAGRTDDAMIVRSLLSLTEGSSRTLLSRSRRLHHRLVHMYTLGQFPYCNKSVTSHKELVPYKIDTLMESPLKRNDLSLHIVTVTGVAL